MREPKVFLSTLFSFACAALLTAQTTNNPPGEIRSDALTRAGIQPIGNWQVDPAETAYLNSLFASATAAADAIVPGPDASAHRRAVDNLLREELENFVATNATSAYSPGLHVLLGNRARMRCGYSVAMEHYQAAFKGLAGSPDPIAFEVAHEAGGSLAKLLALTGRIAELDVLEAQAAQMGPGGDVGYDWGWAKEMRRWVTEHPTDVYKCGLYCLDQLGRLTQPGQFLPQNILERDSSTNGFSAADLVNIATSAGLRVHAAKLSGPDNLPVPCILHLRSEHFVLVREQRGAFYNVVDLVLFGPMWLTLPDILEEATGCVIVSDASPPVAGVSLVPLDALSAAGYRGRFSAPIPADHDDSPVQGPAPAQAPTPMRPNFLNDPNSGPATDQPFCPGGSASSAPQANVLPMPSGSTSSLGAGGRACSGCQGMAAYSVSEPWLNLWLKDVPMSYTPPYGDPLALTLSFTFRRQGSAVSGAFWHGAQFGNFNSYDGFWGCSWLSFAELSAGDATVDLMLPAGGWATFSFPSGSNLSTKNFLHNLVLEKQGPSGGITNLVLHYPDGSLCNYGVYDKSNPSYNGIFYLTGTANPAGNTTTFSYNSSYYLTTVTAPDGTSFTFNYTNTSPAQRPVQAGAQKANSYQ
jgi:YD repeat-containing protein